MIWHILRKIFHQDASDDVDADQRRGHEASTSVIVSKIKLINVAVRLTAACFQQILTDSHSVSTRSHVRLTLRAPRGKRDATPSGGGGFREVRLAFRGSTRDDKRRALLCLPGSPSSRSAPRTSPRDRPNHMTDWIYDVAVCPTSLRAAVGLTRFVSSCQNRREKNRTNYSRNTSRCVRPISRRPHSCTLSSKKTERPCNRQRSTRTAVSVATEWLSPGHLVAETRNFPETSAVPSVRRCLQPIRCYTRVQRVLLLGLAV